MNRFLTFYYRHIKPSFLRKPLHTAASEAPFFILSAGRSGSTLLRKLMLMHTPVNIPPESDDLIPKLIKFYLSYNHKSWEYIVRNCADIYNREEAMAYWKAELREDTLKSLLSIDLKHQSLAAIVHFFYDHYAKAHGLVSERWGDKTPFLTFRLAWINMLYPSARFIFMIRDGRAVVNSFMKMNKGYTIESAASRWLKAMNAMKEQEKKSGKDRILYIRYEALLMDTESEIKRIYNFLHVTPFPKPTNKIILGDDVLEHHHNLKSEIDLSYIDKWKTELSEEEIAKITERMGGWLRELGYL